MLLASRWNLSSLPFSIVTGTLKDVLRLFVSQYPHVRLCFRFEALPGSLEFVAAATQLRPERLKRLLRALIELGVVELDQCGFIATKRGQLLCEGLGPEGLRNPGGEPVSVLLLRRYFVYSCQAGESARPFDSGCVRSCQKLVAPNFELSQAAFMPLCKLQKLLEVRG